MMRKTRTAFAVAIAGLAALSWAALTSRGESQQGARPQYTAQGELMLPVGFESWVFVGSNLGMVYRRDPPSLTDARTEAREAKRADNQFFHNVYISPEAYAHFAATKEYPDPTILVMEVYTAGDKQQQPVLSTGVFNDRRVGLEVAVKDSRRPPVQPAPPPPALWQYYVFQDPGDPSSPLQAAVKPEETGSAKPAMRSTPPGTMSGSNSIRRCARSTPSAATCYLAAGAFPFVERAGLHSPAHSFA